MTLTYELKNICRIELDKWQLSSIGFLNRSPAAMDMIRVVRCLTSRQLIFFEAVYFYVLNFKSSSIIAWMDHRVL